MTAWNTGYGLVMDDDDYPESYWALTPAMYREFHGELEHLRKRVAELEAENQWLAKRAGRPLRQLEETLEQYGVSRAMIFDATTGKRLPNPHARFIAAVRQAANRGKTWDIPPDAYAVLLEQPCEDCGGPTGNGVGLDRLDHDLGYSVGNVRPCCGPCNLRRGRRPVGSSAQQ